MLFLHLLFCIGIWSVDRIFLCFVGCTLTSEDTQGRIRVSRRVRRSHFDRTKLQIVRVSLYI